MNKELLIYFFNENWILFAGLFLASVMTYVSFVAGRFSSLSPEQTIRYINDGAWVVDIREEDNFKKEHIEGASNLPTAIIEKSIEPALKKQRDPANILLYCSNGSQSASVIKKLSALSLNAKLHFLQGGINAWKEAQYPISKTLAKTKKNKK